MASAGPPNDSPWLPSEWGHWSAPEDSQYQVRDEPRCATSEVATDERKKAWDEAAAAVKMYHDDLMEQWQKAMDSVLVYAGLFSSVLTAFNVQSYQLLQPAPTDAMLAALQQISTELNSFSINPSFINSTQPAARSLDQLQIPFRAPASAVWINALWFASLLSSLASASIALMVKQWLYEESNGLLGASRETARLRQYRLRTVIKWKVETIVLIPSMLLQVALFLFLAGLLILLWTLHETVAAVITTLIGAFFFSAAIVTILPSFWSDCCYRSPQARGVHAVVKTVWNRIVRVVSGSLYWLLGHISLPRPPGVNQSKGPAQWRERLKKLLIRACISCSLNVVRTQVDTWNGLEQRQIKDQIQSLDRHIATMAYTTTFATEDLEALRIILSGLPPDQVFSCFSEINRAWSQLLGSPDAVRNLVKVPEILCGQPFYSALRKTLTGHPDSRSMGTHCMELSSDYLLSSYGAEQYIPLSGKFHATLALMSMGDSNLSMKAFDLLWRCSPYTRGEKEVYPDDFKRYDVIRDVMAMARYNIEHWPPSCRTYPMWRTLMPPRVRRTGRRHSVDDSEGLEHMLLTVYMSLRWAQSGLMDESTSQLSSNQEHWIRDETLSFLTSLCEKLATSPLGDIRPNGLGYWLSDQVAWWLDTTYPDHSSENKTIPDKFSGLQALRSSFSGQDSTTSWAYSVSRLWDKLEEMAQ